MAHGITLAQAIGVFERELGCTGGDGRDAILDAIQDGIEFMLFHGGGELLREWIVTVRRGRFTFPRDLETPIKYKVGCTAEQGFGTIRSSFYPYSSQSITNCCGYNDWDINISVAANRVATQFHPNEKGVRLLATTRDDNDVGKKIMVQGNRCKNPVQPLHNDFKTAGELLTIYKEDDPNKKYGAWLFDEITGVVKDPTCSYVTLWGYEDITKGFTFLSHYTPDEEVPQYREGQISSCGVGCCDFELHILGRIAPGIRYSRDEDILPISSIGILNLLAKRARYYDSGDHDKVGVIEERLRVLIKKQVAYQQKSARQLSFSLGASGATLANI